MKRAFILCLPLTLAACGQVKEGVLALISPGENTPRLEGPSQAPAMQAYGLKKYPYTHDMWLVSCMNLEGICPNCYHTKRTIEDRLQELEQHLNHYLADCGEYDEENVWGK